MKVYREDRCIFGKASRMVTSATLDAKGMHSYSMKPATPCKMVTVFYK